MGVKFFYGNLSNGHSTTLTDVASSLAKLATLASQ